MASGFIASHDQCRMNIDCKIAIVTQSKTGPDTALNIWSKASHASLPLEHMWTMNQKLSPDVNVTVPGRLLGSTVSSCCHLLTAPSLYAQQVKHAATASRAVPDCIIIVHSLQAYEADSSTALCAVQLLSHSL